MKAVGDPSSWVGIDSAPTVVNVVPASSAMKGSFSALSSLAISEDFHESRRCALVSKCLMRFKRHTIQHVHS